MRDIDNKRFIEFLNRREPTADEYEAEMAPLREALKKEVAKTDVETYEDLTIRQFAEFWEVASGGMHWVWPLEQVACQYDLDSPANFYKFYLSLPGNHFLDLIYAVVSLHPRYVSPEEPDGKMHWMLDLFSHGNAFMTARYVQRLQQAGVHFRLRPAKSVLKDFNKEVGYRKRSLRRLEKMKDENETK